MAKKRLLTLEGESEKERKQPEALPEPTWRDWLKGTYARYWYVLGCFFLDIVIFIEAQRTGFGGWALPFALVVLAVGAETLLYLRIWPRRRDEDQEEVLEEEDFL